MPDDTPDETPVPEPGPDDADAPDPPLREIADQLIRTLARRVPRAQVQRLLVDLTKRRASEVLDHFAEIGRSGETITLAGTSTTQIFLVERWLREIVVPQIVKAYGEFLDGGAPDATKITLAWDERVWDARVTKDPASPGFSTFTE